MSLNVTPEIVEKAARGRLTPDGFLAVVRESLPRAWRIMEFHGSEIAMGLEVSLHAPPSMDDGTRGELLRLVASSAMRTAVERHFGFRLEFQNCHKSAAFAPEAIGGPVHQEFVSMEAQILNQSPDMRDC